MNGLSALFKVCNQDMLFSADFALQESYCYFVTSVLVAITLNSMNTKLAPYETDGRLFTTDVSVKLSHVTQKLG